MLASIIEGRSREATVNSRESIVVSLDRPEVQRRGSHQNGPPTSFRVVHEILTDYQLLARGLHADGTQRFGPLEVNSGANGQQRRPAVSTNASGQFVVAWEDDIDGNGIYQIVARGFSAMGAD